MKNFDFVRAKVQRNKTVASNEDIEIAMFGSFVTFLTISTSKNLNHQFWKFYWNTIFRYKRFPYFITEKTVIFHEEFILLRSQENDLFLEILFERTKRSFQETKFFIDVIPIMLLYLKNKIFKISCILLFQFSVFIQFFSFIQFFKCGTRLLWVSTISTN